MRDRLIKESIRINSVSLRNLSIGVSFCAIGILITAIPLFTLIFISAPDLDKATLQTPEQWLIRYFLPRFSVGLIASIIGFFFLRLYANNENDAKQNKNEISNFEARMIALLISTKNNKQVSGSVIDAFAKTERNFILKKNEKTSGEFDHATIKDFLDLHFKSAQKPEK
jgi:hypothetical protein